MAWEPLGFEAAWFSEIAPFPCAVLKHRFPKVKNHGSLIGLADRLVGRDREIDFLVGGTPCQGNSIAGRRRGRKDERDLASEYARLVEALRPRWLLWENVPGVLSVEGGRSFGGFIGQLCELGYGVAWRVLDAQFFGVAQRRERVFLVGSLGGHATAGAVLFEPEGVRRNPPARRKTGEEVAGTLGGGSARRGTPDDTDRMTFVPEISPTLRAQGNDPHRADSMAYVSEVLATNAEGADGFTLTKSNLSKTVNNQTPLLVASFDPTQITHHENRSNASPDTAALAKSARAPHIAYPIRSDAVRDGIAKTPSADAKGGVRRLVPRECERLQDFPDDWTLVPVGKKLAADGPRYAALGNSMAVCVMRWLGLRIALVDSLLRGTHGL